MPSRSRTLAFSIAVCCSLFIGCNNDGKYPVSGSITWEGELIPDDHNAHVIFTAVDPSIGPDAVQLEAGKFSFRSSPGEKKVEIFIDKPVGDPDPVMKTQSHQQYIPTRYNEKTELSVNVTAEGPNEFTFDLVKKKGDVLAGAK